MTKVLLVIPEGKINKLKAGPFKLSFREAPLTLTTLAALVPDDLDISVRCVDESVQRIPFRRKFDIVGISCMTGTSTRGYEIAEKFRERGSVVVLGGIHVTLRPEEAQRHADVIISGFAETAWPRFLHDYSRGTYKKRYHSDDNTIINLPAPRRELQGRFRYMIPNTVAATRGCKGECEFCSVPAADFGWSKRHVGSVIDELRNIRGKRVVFSDVHLTQESAYAKELFRAMIPLRKQWGGLASTRIANDPELLDLIAESGCSYLLIGFESLSDESLRLINKGFNRSREYKNLVDHLHARNIVIQGCFIFGFDGDTKETFRQTVDTINELGIDIPRFAVFTPYPGTHAFERLESEGRLLHKEWYYYDTQHVVFVPQNMTARELDAGLIWSFSEAFKLENNLIRTAKGGKNGPITFLGNLAYKLYVRRLRRDDNRFPVPGSSLIDLTYPQVIDRHEKWSAIAEGDIR
jgi:radical SAM superfamily enzyme YgiQ (UPF0313 family)